MILLVVSGVASSPTNEVTHSNFYFMSNMQPKTFLKSQLFFKITFNVRKDVVSYLIVSLGISPKAI